MRVRICRLICRVRSKTHLHPGESPQLYNYKQASPQWDASDDKAYVRSNWPQTLLLFHCTRKRFVSNSDPSHNTLYDKLGWSLLPELLVYVRVSQKRKEKRKDKGKRLYWEKLERFLTVTGMKNKRDSYTFQFCSQGPHARPLMAFHCVLGGTVRPEALVSCRREDLGHSRWDSDLQVQHGHVKADGGRLASRSQLDAGGVAWRLELFEDNYLYCSVYMWCTLRHQSSAHNRSPSPLCFLTNTTLNDVEFLCYYFSVCFHGLWSHYGPGLKGRRTFCSLCVGFFEGHICDVSGCFIVGVWYLVFVCCCSL